jgi:ribosomal-protein-alanine N-acetyltransferase
MTVIAAATAADLDAIDELERHSFTTPWPRKTFEEQLASEWARLDIARGAAGVVGFSNYWLVAGEVHILAIATHPDHRRRGIGRALLDHLLAAGRAQPATLATLEVRRSNLPAIALYEASGFRTVHTRKGYYQDNDEDALVMLLALTGSSHRS